MGHLIAVDLALGYLTFVYSLIVPKKIRKHPELG
jgi:hypothetical protein